MESSLARAAFLGNAGRIGAVYAQGRRAQVEQLTNCAPGVFCAADIEEASYFSVFGKAAMDAKIGLILDYISQMDPLSPAATSASSGSATATVPATAPANRQSARELQTLRLLTPTRSIRFSSRFFGAGAARINLQSPSAATLRAPF